MSSNTNYTSTSYWCTTVKITFCFDVVCAAFDLQTQSRPHLRYRGETPGGLRAIWVPTVVLLQTSEKKTSFYNHVISLVMTSRPWLDLKHSLAFVGVGVEGMLVRVLGVPRLTRDPRRGLVDLTAVVFSTATETVGGEAGALAFLHPDFSWAEEPNSRSVNSHLCHWITKM